MLRIGCKQPKMSRKTRNHDERTKKMVKSATENQKQGAEEDRTDRTGPKSIKVYTCQSHVSQPEHHLSHAEKFEKTRETCVMIGNGIIKTTKTKHWIVLNCFFLFGEPSQPFIYSRFSIPTIYIAQIGP